jgi:hypothetical protein
VATNGLPERRAKLVEDKDASETAGHAIGRHRPWTASLTGSHHGAPIRVAAGTTMTIAILQPMKANPTCWYLWRMAKWRKESQVNPSQPSPNTPRILHQPRRARTTGHLPGTLQAKRQIGPKTGLLHGPLRASHCGDQARGRQVLHRLQHTNELLSQTLQHQFQSSLHARYPLRSQPIRSQSQLNQHLLSLSQLCPPVQLLSQRLLIVTRLRV